jgi:hypothetical protein
MRPILCRKSGRELDMFKISKMVLRVIDAVLDLETAWERATVLLSGFSCGGLSAVFMRMVTGMHWGWIILGSVSVGLLVLAIISWRISGRRKRLNW